MAKNKNIKNETEEELTSQEQETNNNTEEPTEVENNEISEENSEETVIDEMAALKDKHLRLQAEFDNYRKRTLSEKVELIKSAGEGVLVKLLPVIDDFDRAMESFKTTENVDSMKEGMELISNKLQMFLKQNGLKEIDAKEQIFDTDKHEALTKIPAPTEELKGKVVDVIEKGYELNEKVIRFAKVVIGE